MGKGVGGSGSKTSHRKFRRRCMWPACRKTAKLEYYVGIFYCKVHEKVQDKINEESAE